MYGSWLKHLQFIHFCNKYLLNSDPWFRNSVRNWLGRSSEKNRVPPLWSLPRRGGRKENKLLHLSNFPEECRHPQPRRRRRHKCFAVLYPSSGSGHRPALWEGRRPLCGHRHWHDFRGKSLESAQCPRDPQYYFPGLLEGVPAEVLQRGPYDLNTS